MPRFRYSHRGSPRLCTILCVARVAAPATRADNRLGEEVRGIGHGLKPCLAASLGNRQKSAPHDVADREARKLVLEHDQSANDLAVSGASDRPGMIALRFGDHDRPDVALLELATAVGT